MSARGSGLWRWGSVTLSALLLVAAAPPYSWGVLAVPAVALLTGAVVGAGRARTAVLIGAVHGAVYFAVLIRWVYVVTPVALVALVALTAAWGGLLTWLLWRARDRRWTLVAAPACWVLVETLRSSVPWGGFPWGRLAFVGGLGDVTRLALVVSAAGLTYAVALAGGLLSRWWQLRRVPARDLLACALAGAALSGAVAASAPPTGPKVSVLLVQGGVPRQGLMTAEQERQVFANHLDVTRSGLRRAPATQDSARLVVWPESSVGYAALADGRAVQELQAVVDSSEVALLSGSVIEDTTAASGLRNRAMLWQPGRGVTDTYDKQHLVPFGEFVPLRSIARKVTAKVDLVGRDFIPGTRPGIFTIPGSTVSLGDLICFEVAYDASVRQLARVGIVVNQTNNATYLGSGQPSQQYRMAQVRAAELGKPVLVAATSGVTGAIDARGRTIVGTLVEDNVARARWVTVRSSAGTPPSAHTGPLLQWACAIVVAVLVLPRRRRRERGGRP